MSYSTTHGGQMSSQEKFDTGLIIVSLTTIVGFVIYLLIVGG